MPAHAPPVEPEYELTLLLAGTARSRDARGERIRELLSRVHFPTLEVQLQRQGMLALIGQRLGDIATFDLPESFRGRVAEYTLTARRQSLYQQMLTMRLMAELEEEGIRVLPLKGPLLGERLYDDLGARVSADIDLLVAERDLSHAAHVLTRFGYERHRHASRGRLRVALHERLVHPSELPEVELHWRVHWYERSFSAHLLARSVAGPDGCLRPRPADELVELLLLYARDGFAGLRLAADVAAWWDRYGAELESEALTEAAARYPAISRALATAALLAERLVGLPAPDLLSPSVLCCASPLAMRLANWPLRGAESQISANVSLIDWVLSPARDWRVLTRRHLLLTREDVLTRWPDAESSTRRLQRLRALHALRVVGRYAIASWMVLRHQSWSSQPESLGGSDVH